MCYKNQNPKVYSWFSGQEMKIVQSSKWDFLLLAISVLHVAGLFYLVLNFKVMDLSALLICGFAIVFLICTNYQCVAHNFIHHPFFTERYLNTLFSIFNTLALGSPQSIYRVHHLLHHKYNNKYTETEKDESSIFLYSKKMQVPESILSYSLLGPFRTDFKYLYGKLSPAFKKTFFLELTVMLLFWAGLIAIDVWFFIGFFLPTWYLGQSAALFENYLEHYGADPENKLADSVSCYNPVYNFLWFNNGYHQEHHCKPQMHWTEIPSVRSEMLRDNQRVIVPVCHLWNLFVTKPVKSE